MRIRLSLLAAAVAAMPFTSVLAQSTGPNTKAGATHEADKVKEGSAQPSGDHKQAGEAKAGDNGSK